ncbi:MAG TPA: aminodeoxychorismate/anthranilate synthase component II [Bacteroidia bacterium]|nr:aminodeoxychorismate/anthranilate synthase component II [Bacteroidia bacterium]
MLILLDNYDSFTYNLKDYLEQLGATCHVVRNDEITVDELKKLTFSAIVISPGPQKPADAGILNAVISEFHTTHPILGICLGHQALGEFFGARLVKAKTPMHGKVSEIFHTGEKIFQNISSPFTACRYHSLLLAKWGPELPLVPVAHTSTGEVMALRHATLPLWGVQFHPEAILTSFGLQLLENWLNLLPKPEIWQL